MWQQQLSLTSAVVLGYILFHTPSQRSVLACKPVTAPGKNGAKKMRLLV